MRVYLAGKMGGRLGADVLEERAAAVLACKGHHLNPVDPAASESIDPARVVDLSMDYTTMKNFVAKDEYAIRHCQALLVLTGDTPSEGTGWEMALAHYELKIPVVMVAPRRVAGALMGFSNIKVDAMFETVSQAAAFIASNYSEAYHAIHY